MMKTIGTNAQKQQTSARWRHRDWRSSTRPRQSSWEQFGCPTATGRDWTTKEIQVAINRGPHESALELDAIKHFAAEVAEKVAKGQARVVLWDEIKDNHP